VIQIEIFLNMDFENLHGNLWLCLLTVGCVVVARGQGHAGGCYTMSYTMEEEEDQMNQKNNLLALTQRNGSIQMVERNEIIFVLLAV
jgi:hypothetical protein